jgi:ABC-type polysaccharide/polyol phosphate transport system ATPase subunit
MCSKGVLVNNGTIDFIGDIEEVGERYSKLF